SPLSTATSSTRPPTSARRLDSRHGAVMPVAVMSRSSTPSRAAAASTRIAPAPGSSTGSLGAGATSASLQPAASSRAASRTPIPRTWIMFRLIARSRGPVNGPVWLHAARMGDDGQAMRHALPLAIGLVAALALPLPAQARGGNKPKRKGGQAEVMVGASACVPGKGDCKAEGFGDTAPSVGMAFDVGWRAHPAFFVGAGYGIGWFNPTWQDATGRAFKSAFNQGVFGILRAYIPVWRIDIGF